MEFAVFNQKEKAFYKEQIIQMMCKSDDEFVPPLSARNSTLQKDLTNYVQSSDGIFKYYAEMEKQEILGAFECGELVGFVSFKVNFVNDVITSDTLKNIYLSTLIIKPKMRGKGVTKSLYDYLFNNLYPTYSVFTRTWSTNLAHTNILYKFGFKEFFRINNDRGQGVDTVYFALDRRK